MDFWRRRSRRVLLRSQLAPAPGGGVGGSRPDEGGNVGAVEDAVSIAVSILLEISKTGVGERGPLVVGGPGDGRVGSGKASRAAGVGWGGRAGRGLGVTDKGAGVIRDSIWSLTSRWRDWARDSKRVIILSSNRSEMRSKSRFQSGAWVA